MIKRWLVGMAVVALPFLLWAVAAAQGDKPAVAAGSTGLIVLPSPGTAPKLPSDIDGGAPQSSLTQAAAFAWQEFIALTWPAEPNGQPAGYNRDTADPKAVYGKGAADASGPPLVWETYRHKVEIFPGTTSPADYKKNTPPHGATRGGPDFGYNEPPQYDYATGVVTGPCEIGDTHQPAAWVNLDENSQIFLDTMYAGVLGPHGDQPASGQEILFLAKANKVDYAYMVDPRNSGGTELYQGFWNHSYADSPNNSNPQYTQAVQNFLNYQSVILKGGTATLQNPYVSLPSGTVEVKSAWRPLTAGEAKSGKFHLATVRFYEEASNLKPNGLADGVDHVCYRQATWGMIALHIIQKTPSAPYFIYATFSQADNIQGTIFGYPASVEDAEGRQVIQNPGPDLDSGLSAPAQNPVRATVLASSKDPGTEKFNVTTASCKPAGRLYYQNTVITQNGKPITPQLTPQGNVCVNQRTHPIPQEIIGVNQAAHDAIKSYNQSNNNGNSTPWLYYKLINVQAKPIDKNPEDYGKIYTKPDSATYYQSNDVVETNFNLQFFSGRLVSEKYGVLMSDFRTDGSPFKNTFFLEQPTGSPVKTFNMGGCMGCHGNAQQAGDDFSFILNVGRNDEPDTLPAPAKAATGKAATGKAAKGKGGAVRIVRAVDKVKKFHLPG